MRRYTVVVNGNEFTLDVRELASDRFQVKLGERQLEVVLAHDAELPEGSITPAIVTGETPALTHTIDNLRPASLPVPPANSGAAGTRQLTAPMPGTISRVEVAEGATVKRGDVLMMLEAMKMMNPIRAPRDGAVAEVRVETGQTVAYGDILLRFEDSAR